MKTTPGAEEIGTSVAENLLEQISTAKYPRRAHVGRNLARAAAAHKISVPEIDAVIAASHRRIAELTAKSPVAFSPDAEPTLPSIGEWTPLRVLDSLPQGEREPDARERQLPNGDRD